MYTQNTSTEKKQEERYGRPQNIRVLLSSYLVDLRESKYEKRVSSSAR